MQIPLGRALPVVMSYMIASFLLYSLNVSVVSYEPTRISVWVQLLNASEFGAARDLRAPRSGCRPEDPAYEHHSWKVASLQSPLFAKWLPITPHVADSIDTAE